MPQNLWNASEAARLPDLDGLVYRSNLLGRDRAVVNIFGGNTSAKLRMIDHVGREQEVLAVKASGSDVLTITEPQFALLKMDEIEPLYQREAMSDEDMVAWLERTWFEPGRPRQSIETLLHAFVPHKHVDHTHPDALISLMCVTDAEAEARHVYGQRAAYVPYIRPGFTLSKWIGGMVRDNPRVECVVMGKHGLVTWGPDSKTSYDSSIRIIQETEDYLADRRVGKKVFGDLRVPGLSRSERDSFLAEVLPVIRGAVSTRRSAILQTDSSDTRAGDGGQRQDSRSQPDRRRLPRPPRARQAPAALCRLVAAGRRCVVLAEKIRSGIADYEARYVSLLSRRTAIQATSCATLPRASSSSPAWAWSTPARTLPTPMSVASFTTAPSPSSATQKRWAASSASPPNEAYNIEYWPLELYKLKLAPPDRDFAGKVALITGAASGIGRATAYASGPGWRARRRGRHQLRRAEQRQSPTLRRSLGLDARFSCTPTSPARRQCRKRCVRPC